MDRTGRILMYVIWIGSFTLGAIANECHAASLTFDGSQFDLGGTFFPTYTYPQNSIVPWRSDGEANFFSVSPDINNRYYGTAGYALFATNFSFPNADAHPPAANANINPTTGDSNYPNIINLPN